MEVLGETRRVIPTGPLGTLIAVMSVLAGWQ
jgi:hypothetical protein